MAPMRLSTWLAEPWLLPSAPAVDRAVFPRFRASFAPRRKMAVSSLAHCSALPREIDPSVDLALRIAAAALRNVVFETLRAETAPGLIV